MRFADDLDIAPDGRIFFSEATMRFDITEWAVDALEARGNGRILCYDPRDKSTRTVISNLQFPNGICVTHDGQSILFAETWGCRVQRYWFAGPKAGKREIVIENCRAIPTTSTAPRTAITGLRSSACARPPSIWPGACRRCAGAWSIASRTTNGSIPT